MKNIIKLITKLKKLIKYYNKIEEYWLKNIHSAYF